MSAVANADGHDRRRAGVPRTLVVASEYAWRALVVVGALAAVAWAVAYVGFVVAPVVGAIFAAAMLEPVRRLLVRWGLSRQVAAIVAFAVGVVLVTGIVVSAAGQLYSDFDELTDQTSAGVERITSWFDEGPLGLDAEGVENAVDDWIAHLREEPGRVASGALSVLTTTGGLLAGGVLAFVTTLFLMVDRDRIHRGIRAALPARHRTRADEALRAAWDVLVSYVQVTLTEAVLCAVVIGSAAAIAGLPVSFALAVVVFLLGFIPTIGAVLSGVVVVLVALVTKGLTQAVVLAAIVLLVQQLDANLLYPYLTSRRLSIHPLASLLLVTTGAVAAGLFGALLAVPVTAMLIAARGSWVGDPTLEHIAPP